MPKVAASLLAADFTRLIEDVRSVGQAGIDWLHCDVMDGHFVPNLSFGPFIIRQIKQITTLPLDVHLMITNPEKYIGAYIDAGADFLTVHGEVIGENPKVFQLIRAKGVRAGISLNPEARIEDYFSLFPHVDLFLVMSVNAGFGGQSFIPDVLEKVRTAVRWREEHGYNYLISIDGGVNADTAVLAKAAGVDVLVAGTAFFQAESRLEFVRRCKSDPKKPARE